MHLSIEKGIDAVIFHVLQVIDDVGVEDLEELGIYDEVVNSYEEDGGDPYDVAHIEAVGSPAGYLFRCRHCGKYHLHIDYD